METPNGAKRPSARKFSWMLECCTPSRSDIGIVHILSIWTRNSLIWKFPGVVLSFQKLLFLIQNCSLNLDKTLCKSWNTNNHGAIKPPLEISTELSKMLRIWFLKTFLLIMKDLSVWDLCKNTLEMKLTSISTRLLMFTSESENSHQTHWIPISKILENKYQCWK